MTIAHKDLTGTDLHETKGASTATAGQVPVANGVGGAPFGLLDRTSLTGTGNPFGAQLVHIQETQPTGTNPGTPTTTGSWTNVILNTVLTNEVTNASLSSNNIVLPAGTYFIEVFVPWVINTAGAVLQCQTRLLNNTTSVVIMWGRTVQGGSIGSPSITGASTSYSIIRGRFTLTTSSSLVIQHYKTGGAVGQPSGLAGSNEIYSEVLIWKTA